MKIKLLFLINDLGPGGAERVLVNLVNHLDKTKYDITVRTVMNRGINRQFLNPKVKYESVFKIPFKGINHLYKLPKKILYNRIAKGDFDVIIVYLHGVLTKIVSHAPEHQKTISYLHANMEHSPFLKSFKTIKKREKCFKSYNKIVAVSDSVKTSFINNTGIKENVEVIYNTFDVKSIIEKSKTKITPLSSNEEELIFCCVGSLDKVKGFDRLIRVLTQLKSCSTPFKLLIIGEGAERKNLEKLIIENNLSHQITIKGFKENPYKYIARSDLLISSSYSEGFSSVVVEAIILGTAVLTTNTSGMTEILGNKNEYGWVVDNNENALMEALNKILNDPNILIHYKKQAKKRSFFFSTEKTVRDVENLIDKVLAHE